MHRILCNDDEYDLHWTLYVTLKSWSLGLEWLEYLTVLDSMIILGFMDSEVAWPG